MANYQILVGNIGTVYNGSNLRVAQVVYNEWVAESKLNVGKVAGEPVTFFRGDEIFKEYEGTLNEGEDE